MFLENTLYLTHAGVKFFLLEIKKCGNCVVNCNINLMVLYNMDFFR